MALADTLPIRGDHPRILVLRLSALGDIVFATALLEGLRARWPQAHIAWAAQPGFAGILEGDPRIDDLIRLSPKVFSNPIELLRAGRTLSRGGFDWVIDAQGLFKTRLLARLTSGATRIGFESREPGAAWMHRRLPKGGDIRDISSEYRFLAQQFTGQDPGPPRLPISAAALQGVRERMHGSGLQPGFIAFCPFTTRPQKHWMEDYWGRLAQLLHEQQAPRVVLFGGPGDREAAQRIADTLPPGSVNLVGQTKLGEIAAWLSLAGLVIGVDTGLTHIGIAVKRPVLALFGSTCPYTQGAESPLTVMYDALPCAPCKRHPTCGGAYSCMRGLTPERVAAASLDLLRRT